jgi:hypothetical protein
LLGGKLQIRYYREKKHITELFEKPSTFKNQEVKMKDEFFILRGYFITGNNSPHILKKFKIVKIIIKK